VRITATQNRTAATNTTVNLSTTNGTADAGDYTAPSAITITASNPSGFIDFATIDDDIDEDNETLTIQISSVSGGQGAQAGTPQQVSVTINDDDTADINFRHIGSDTTISESGTLDSLVLKLATKPTDNVVVDITYDDSSELNITSSTQLTYTTSDWYVDQTISLSAIDDVIDDGETTVKVTATINTSLTADSKYDLVGSKNKNVTVQDNDLGSQGAFDIDNITPDFGRLILGWDAPSSFDANNDSYLVYWTTVAPASRTPANRLVDERDNVTPSILGTATNYVHGGLTSGATYYYRLAAIDTSNSNIVSLSTNEISSSPLPVECTSTGGNSEITDNDSDLLFYYPLNSDLQDYSPANGRTAVDGWPYHLTDANDRITYGEGCAYGNAAYFDGDKGGLNTKDDGTWAKNDDFDEADLGATPDNWTLSLWVNPDGDMEKDHSAFSNGPSNKCEDQNFQIDLDNNMRIGQDGASDSNTSSCNDSKMRQANSIEIGVWYHLTLVNFSDDSAKLYRNGVQTNSKSAGNWYTTWDQIRIGLNRHGKSNWKGYIDEIKLYGRSMSDTEINQLYNQSLPPIVVGLSATGGGSGTIDLSWDAVSSSTSYVLYRKEQSVSGLTDVITFDQANVTSSDASIITTTNIQAGCVSGTCTQSVTGLTTNKWYYFRIAAVNGRGTGNVAPSGEVSLQAP